MAPSKTNSTARLRAVGKSDTSPPRPFKRAPDSLQPFYEALSEKHVYIAHVDNKPRDFKRKIFVVPVLLNVAVASLFAWRLVYIGPYYLRLFASVLGYANETTLVANELSWGDLTTTVLRRGFTFMLDMCLAVFVWPWPMEFCFARGGSPVGWRWAVGFRDKEIYVRRSRDWDKLIGTNMREGAEGRDVLLSRVKLATSPQLLQEKTGYLTMNGEWDLDWGAMVHATDLVDRKDLALDAFRILVLLHHQDYGWMCIDPQVGETAQEDERRRQVFAFRDALAGIGKEDLFFRWIEIVQFESSQPSGFGPEKQAELARTIRELFSSNGVDFDEFWNESVGSNGLAGM